MMGQARDWEDFYKEITVSDIKTLIDGIDRRNRYVRAICENIEGFDSGNALEFGSGTGSMSLYLSGIYPRLKLSLLDFSFGALRKSSAYFAASDRKASFVGGAIERLPFKDGKFHLVFGHTVLEHIRDYESAFGELARVTKKGGFIITNVPNRYRPDGSLWYKKAYGARYLTMEFSMGELEALYEKNGFEVVKKFGSRFIYIDPVMICWLFGLGGIIRRYTGMRDHDADTAGDPAYKKGDNEKAVIRVMKGFNRGWIKMLTALDNIFNSLPLPASSYINIGIIGRKR